MTRWIPSVGLGMCLIVLAAPPLAAQDATSAFTEVTVDLEGGLVRQTLPFDVPFVFTGQAPTGVQKIYVRCWEVETCRQALRDPTPAEQAACAGKPKTLTLAPDTTGAPDGNCPTWPRPPARGSLQSLPSWTNRVDPTAEQPSFAIFVPRLEAEKYYTFGFLWDRTPSAEETAAFAAEVTEAADTVLWTAAAGGGTLPASGDLTNDDLAALRDRLVAALLEVTAADRIQDCSESEVLCPDVPIDQVRGEFNRLLRGVRNAQGQLRASIDTYKNEVDQLNVALGRLRASAELAALLQAARQAAAATPSLGDEVSALEATLALPDLPDLGEADRRSPAALGSFAAAARDAAGQAAAQVGTVRTFLGQGLLGPQGEPTPLGEQLTATGALAPGAAAGLAALAEPRGPVGSVDRALARLQGQAAAIETALAGRATARDALAAEFRTRAEVIVLLAGTTLADFVTNQKNYLSGDGGVAFAPELDDATSYVGTNIYSRPINKAAALSQFGNFWQTLDRRLALTIGLTVDGIGDGETREDLFNNQSLLLGLGARLTGSLRLTVGAVVFKKSDPNPLVDDQSLTATPYLSISFDVDVVPALTGLGNAFKSGS